MGMIVETFVQSTTTTTNIGRKTRAQYCSDKQITALFEIRRGTVIRI